MSMTQILIQVRYVLFPQGWQEKYMRDDGCHPDITR
jgi:hypothetical protein